MSLSDQISTPGQVVLPGGSGSGGGSVAIGDISDWPAGVSATEVGYLDGATSALQTQINGKAATSHTHAATDLASGQVALARGGTGSDLSATGGSGHYLKQASAGAAVTVGAITSADLGLTTNGDLLTVIGGALSRLGISGTDGDVLTRQSGLPAWATPSGGGGIVGVSEKTADYTLLTADKDYLFSVNSASDRQITVDGSLDLPTGGMIHFSRAGTGEVTIAASGATVNSPSGLRLRAQHSMATLVCVAADTYLLTGDTKV